MGVSEVPAGEPDPRAMGSEMPTSYRPAEVEPAVYARWLAADVFAPDGAGSTPFAADPLRLCAR